MDNLLHAKLTDSYLLYNSYPTIDAITTKSELESYAASVGCSYCCTAGAPDFKKPKKFIPPGKKEESEERLMGLNDEVHGIELTDEQIQQWMEEWQRIQQEQPPLIRPQQDPNIYGGHPIWIYDPNNQPYYGSVDPTSTDSPVIIRYNSGTGECLDGQ